MVYHSWFRSDILYRNNPVSKCICNDTLLLNFADSMPIIIPFSIMVVIGPNLTGTAFWKHISCLLQMILVLERIPQLQGIQGKNISTLLKTAQRSSSVGFSVMTTSFPFPVLRFLGFNVNYGLILCCLCLLFFPKKLFFLLLCTLADVFAALSNVWM